MTTIDPQAAAGDGLSRARIEQRFRTNSGLIVATRVVTACLSLATIPVLVSRLGVAGYGTWEALLAFATLTSMFQAAVSGTLVWRIAEAYGRGDTVEIRRLVRVGAGACLALFVILWPLAWFLREPVVRLLGVSGPRMSSPCRCFRRLPRSFCSADSARASRRS